MCRCRLEFRSEGTGALSPADCTAAAACRALPPRLPVSGILKGYDQLLNVVLDDAVEYLRGAGPGAACGAPRHARLAPAAAPPPPRAQARLGWRRRARGAGQRGRPQPGLCLAVGWRGITGSISRAAQLLRPQPRAATPRSRGPDAGHRPDTDARARGKRGGPRLPQRVGR
jgi:hypothetical protein